MVDLVDTQWSQSPVALWAGNARDTAQDWARSAKRASTKPSTLVEHADGSGSLETGPLHCCSLLSQRESRQAGFQLKRVQAAVPIVRMLVLSACSSGLSRLLMHSSMAVRRVAARWYFCIY